MTRTSFATVLLFPALLAAFWLLSFKSKLLHTPLQKRAPAASSKSFSSEEEKTPVFDEAETRRMIFLLQYLGNDYSRAVQHGEIVDAFEFSEMQSFAQTVLQSYRGTTTVREGLERLRAQINAKTDFTAIRTLCAQLVGEMTRESGLVIFPLTTPDLNLGKQLFIENCVSCHGASGEGNGPAADTLNPKPRDLTAPAYLDFVTPFHLYQALTLGVSGTAMPSFGEAFSSEQSWSLAFYLMTLRRYFAPLAPRFDINFSLQQLAVQTNLELQRSLSRDAQASKLSPQQVANTVDYYRSNLPKLSIAEHVKIAKTKWRESLACYQRGDSTQALAYLVDGYMEGFEPIEVMLANKVYLRVERLVTEYRWCVEEKGSFEKAEAFVEEMITILDEILKNPRMHRA